MQIIRWQDKTPPTEQQLRERIQREGLSPYTWSNGANYRYAAHTHSYEKVLYCVQGSIRFVLPEQVNADGDVDFVDLNPGDCMILPPHIVHGAVVGPHGVTCLEATR
jgi:mannose-6-phosphate isomerase-like protein (cupin superfamily)